VDNPVRVRLLHVLVRERLEIRPSDQHRARPVVVVEKVIERGEAPVPRLERLDRGIGDVDGMTREGDGVVGGQPEQQGGGE
jgi:hypothetical protein